MLQNLRANWRTTSMGISAIILAGVRIGFAIKAHALDEGALSTGLLAILSGVGFIVAGDSAASVSKTDLPQIPNQVDNKKPTNTTP